MEKPLHTLLTTLTLPWAIPPPSRSKALSWSLDSHGFTHLDPSDSRYAGQPQGERVIPYFMYPATGPSGPTGPNGTEPQFVNAERIDVKVDWKSVTPDSLSNARIVPNYSPQRTLSTLEFLSLPLDSPYRKMGLEPGDRLIGINGETLGISAKEGEAFLLPEGFPGPGTKELFVFRSGRSGKFVRIRIHDRPRP